jgi:hypothetical protein
MGKIAQLAGRPHDLVTFWRESNQVIASAVAHDGGACWYTLDPASLLITSHFHEGMLEFPADWLADEYQRDGVNKLADVARSAIGVSTLHEATGGNPAASPRWHRNLTVGGDQEMIARLRARSGEVWGAIGLYREPGRPLFDDEDKRFLRGVTPHLADGARRALLVGEATDPEQPDAPGLVILTERWEIDSASAITSTAPSTTNPPAATRPPPDGPTGSSQYRNDADFSLGGRRGWLRYAI